MPDDFRTQEKESKGTPLSSPKSQVTETEFRVLGSQMFGDSRRKAAAPNLRHPVTAKADNRPCSFKNSLSKGTG